ncbi:Uncharacterized protein Adt_32571 [Abeliophyllum distichum]|uniref:Uncharacterized protein n=1 Tax=Abeliophyllum distichum TaxID=126358 RepID=A0ABD1QTT6_9LAMI
MNTCLQVTLPEVEFNHIVPHDGDMDAEAEVIEYGNSLDPPIRFDRWKFTRSSYLAELHSTSTVVVDSSVAEMSSCSSGPSGGVRHSDAPRSSPVEKRELERCTGVS